MLLGHFPDSDEEHKAHFAQLQLEQEFIKDFDVKQPQQELYIYKQEPKSFSRRQKPRFTYQQRKRKTEEWLIAVKEQKQIFGLRHNQAISYIRNLIVQHFGFISNPSLTSSHNAYNALCEMRCWLYLGRPSNTAYHNFSKPGTEVP